MSGAAHSSVMSPGLAMAADTGPAPLAFKFVVGPAFGGRRDRAPPTHRIGCRIVVDRVRSNKRRDAAHAARRAASAALHVTQAQVAAEAAAAELAQAEQAAASAVADVVAEEALGTAAVDAVQATQQESWRASVALDRARSSFCAIDEGIHKRLLSDLDDALFELTQQPPFQPL
eukprot:TRINITY_DN948_c0_g1_i2.p3 TRINITY_DN948_c0_g1~~TRINITY_DN948_c0_g1_i2.p3  ORF type:complete len:174 (+),score=48.13 TRINITY_DN948_c0_g1_i2:197-718(+)